LSRSFSGLRCHAIDDGRQLLGSNLSQHLSKLGRGTNQAKRSLLLRIALALEPQQSSQKRAVAIGAVAKIHFDTCSAASESFLYILPQRGRLVGSDPANDQKTQLASYSASEHFAALSHDEPPLKQGCDSRMITR